MKLEKLAVILALVVGSVALSQEQKTEVLTLKHKSAEEILPLLQPLIEDGAISGQGNTLVVRARNLEAIRKALSKLDVATRRFSVSLRQEMTREREDPGVRVYRTPTAAEESFTQSVLATDGKEAFIVFSRAIPYTDYLAIFGPWRGGMAQESAYTGAANGVTVRVLGKDGGALVFLSPMLTTVLPSWQAPASPPPKIEHALSTQVEVPLGQWVLVGKSERSRIDESQEGARVYATPRLQDVGYRIFLKVEEEGR